ncbi:MAG: HD domain-containing protein [Patescibacteria group bacterium]|nr:HD domain-containing protein [Patescibacteria group bacterium]
MKAIKINSPLYGHVTIKEPVLIDLIKSPALQRLKKIEQHGTWQLHQSWKKSHHFSRYDHSIGVMLLLRKFNASIEEQLHGLLHDISHTVFSHVADFLFNKDTSKHSYQDDRLGKAFQLQGVNAILKKYGFNHTKILSTSTFPLAERDLPDLCADRIDYTLSDPWAKVFDTADPKKILKDLTVYQQQFVFKSRSGAQAFARLYEKHNRNNWCKPLQIAIYTISAQVLREALTKKIITKKELYTTDEYILKKLGHTKNPIITKKLQQIKNLKIKIVSKKTAADFWGTSKTRVVDPYFLQDGKLIRLSKVDPVYYQRVAAWAAKVKKGFYIKILN